ncbi:DUF4209 domain-containing protein [Idiomarina sp. ST10R2A5]|uniref:DUF4209 domain-containing protein n=1 Tax=Idiomarina sp. ST10R2A5 TaxID=3418368 RepID=UPI003EC72644
MTHEGIELEISLENYLDCEWTHTTLEGQRYCYDSLSRSLRDAYNETASEGAKKTLSVLRSLAELAFTPEKMSEPFETMWHRQQRDTRFLLPKDLGPNTLATLEDILPHIDDPLLKARVADTLWLGGRNTKHASAAIEEYIALPDLSSFSEYTLKVNVTRAIMLAQMLKLKDKVSMIAEEMLGLIQRHWTEEPDAVFILGHALHSTGADRQGLTNDMLVELQSSIEQTAHKLVEDGSHYLAQRVFNLASEKADILGDSDNSIRLKAFEGRCFFDMAEQSLDGRAFEAHFNAAKALATLREIPNAQRDKHCVNKLITELHHKFPKYGRLANESMTEISGESVDVSPVRAESERKVSGKQIPEVAVSHLAYCCEPNLMSQAIEAQKLSQRSFIADLVANAIHFDREGFAIAQSSSSNMLAFQAFQGTSQYMMMGSVLPAIDRINVEHNIDTDMFEALCRTSPIVPTNQRRLVANGLFLGWCRELAQAVYILAPLLENIIRRMLTEANALTVTYDSNGVASQLGLGALLKQEECKTVLGSELTEELKAIFTEPSAYNFRNKVAHGLLCEKECQNFMGLHAWWIILRMLVDSVRGKLPVNCDAEVN